MPLEQAPPDPPQVEALLDKAEGTTAYDIGANTGRTTRVLARHFKRVAAFEPCQESWEELVHVSEDLVGECRVQAFPFAVSDHSGQIELIETENPIKSGQLTSSADSLEWGPEVGRRKVLALTVNHVADMVGPPDFIKIDVEGHEVKVVQGGLTTIEKCKPGLYIEIHDDLLGQEIHGLLDPIYGYALRRVQHPYYQPHEWGYDNHYWLTTIPA